jgi:PAS domain S-box-containing protein
MNQKWANCISTRPENEASMQEDQRYRRLVAQGPSHPGLLALFLIAQLLTVLFAGAAHGAEKLLFLGNKNIAPMVYLEDDKPFSAIAVQKGDTKLLAAINEALRIIKSDGTYQRVLDKWQPTEVVFLTRAQISPKKYAIIILVFFVLLSIAALWLMTLRRQLSAQKLAEQQARAQYSTLRGIIDSTNTPIFSVDGRYCYTSFNKGHAAVMENIYGAKITLGHQLLDYVTVPDDRETAKRNLERAMAGEYFVTEAYSGDTLRSRQYFQVTHNPVKDDKGMVIGVAVLTQDMTEMKELEEDRLANLRFFENMDRINRAIQGAANLEQLMSDVLDVVLKIFDCDRSWLFYPCDPDAPLFRVPMEIAKPEYPGAGIMDADMPMPPEMALNLREALDSNGPVTYTIGTERPVNTVSAEQFAVQSQIIIALYPRTDKPWVFGLHQCSYPRVWTSEEQRLFQGIGRRLADGLTSMLMYRNLLESENRFRTLINQAADTFFLHDMEGQILEVNQTACDSLGYTKEELLTMSVADLDAEFISHDHVTNFWSKLAPDQAVTLEGRHKRKDGTTFPVEVHLGLLQIENRQVILALARDITKRKAAEETLKQLNEELERRVRERTADMENKGRQLLDSRQALMNLVADLNDNATQLAAANAKLQELDRLKSMFIASMSHELRTPLNSIIGFSSILAEEWLGPVTEEQKKNLLTVHRAGQHLLALVNDVIDVSKIEAGKLEVTVSDFDLAEVLVEATNLFAVEIRDKALELQADSLHLQMRTDRRRLSQCLINLLSNAVKFTDWGSIRLAARTFSRDNDNADSWLEITVTDTGMGIRDEDLPLLFNAFVRLPLPVDKSIKGTGLGLYLTKKIVCETLRGEIGVESVFGKGSCFILQIPVQLKQKHGNGNEQGSGG